MRKDNFKRPESRLDYLGSLLSTTQYLISDYELNCCFNDIKNLYDTFRLAKKRFERKDSLQISPSQKKYMQAVVDSIKYPYVLYDFVDKNVRICVVQNKKKYYVYCLNYIPKSSYSHKAGQVGFYCESDNIAKTCEQWTFVLQDYLAEKLHCLSLGVPF